MAAVALAVQVEEAALRMESKVAGLGAWPAVGSCTQTGAAPTAGGLEEAMTVGAS